MVVKTVYHAIVVVASATALAEAAQVAGSGRSKHRPFSLVITEYNNNPKNMCEKQWVNSTSLLSETLISAERSHWFVDIVTWILGDMGTLYITDLYKTKPYQQLNKWLTILLNIDKLAYVLGSHRPRSSTCQCSGVYLNCHWRAYLDLLQKLHFTVAAGPGQYRILSTPFPRTHFHL